MNWSTWRLRLLANFELLCVRVLAGAELAPDRTGCIGNRNLSPLEWSEVLRLAEHHGVLPLVARNLIEDDRAEQGGGLPPEIERTLRSAYEANLRRSMWFAAELARIMQHFERRQLRAVPYKGSVLAQSLYGDLGPRSFSDLDFLISPKDFCATDAKLRWCPVVGQSDFHSELYGLTRLLFLAQLSRFSRMGQLHPGEINFERQPGQIRAVCDSEQDFRNAGGCILQ